MSPPRSTRMELRAQLAQALRAGQQVGLVPAAADGVDREVLDQQQPVPDPPAAALLGQLVLQLPGGEVRGGAEPLDGQPPAVGQEEGLRVARRLERRVAARPGQARLVRRRRAAADVAHLHHGCQEVAVPWPPRSPRSASIMPRWRLTCDRWRISESSSGAVPPSRSSASPRIVLSSSLADRLLQVGEGAAQVGGQLVAAREGEAARPAHRAAPCRCRPCPARRGTPTWWAVPRVSSAEDCR